MDQIQDLLDLWIQISEYNFSNSDKQLDAHYAESNLFQWLLKEERAYYDLLFGQSQDLDKLFLKGEDLLTLLKGLIKYNGYFDAALKEDQLDDFLSTFICVGIGGYRSLSVFPTITYSAPKAQAFQYYNMKRFQFNNQAGTPLKELAILGLGDNLYMIFPLTQGADKSHHYMVMNVLGKLLAADYITDSDARLELDDIYQRTCLAYQAFNKSQVWALS